MNPIIIFMLGILISFCLVVTLTDFYDHQKNKMNQDFIREVKKYMGKYK